MANIIEEVLKQLPKQKISDAAFEGANIVLYTKDNEFFLNNGGMIKDVVDKIKKRVELRPDPSITMDLEKAEKEIKKLLPKEAIVGQILFDPQRSIVVIEAEKPGLVIGKQGAILREIREKTLWVPIIRRTPALRSKLIENVRSVLYQHSDYRRKFLDQIGHRIYDAWKSGKREEWVRISYLGGGRQVGRSCIILQTPESNILLDCGVNVASIDESYPLLEAPEFDIQKLDAVIVSHSHLDHCGFVPYLFKYGYRGPVYCTEPTRDVMSLQLLDYVKIMGQNSGKDPIFGSDDVREMVRHTVSLGYEEVTDITPDVRITLYNAGHILGSSMIHLHVGNGLHNILYTGDLKYGRTTLLEPAITSFPRLETLMIESTYGGKDNILPPKKQCDDELIDHINKTLDRKGKVLIPVLGSGRAQEVLLIIEEAIRNGKLKDIPVYVDGMVWDITAIHTAYPEFLNNSIRKLIFHKDSNPFLAKNFKHVGSQKERMEIVEDKGPCVILATSGMLVGGPSVEYLKHLSSNEKNLLMFVCYQGEGCLGRKIQRGATEFLTSHGQKQEVTHIKMEVHTIDGLTGHSGRKQLMDFVTKCDPRPKKVIVNHGESSRTLDLASSIHKQNRVETVAPRNLDAIRLR
jgi:KH/beta-lactamase-domain protein